MDRTSETGTPGGSATEPARAQTPRYGRSAWRLALVAAGMFAFGYALVPLYDVLCRVTGLNGKTMRVEASELSAEVDLSRTVSVEFSGQAMDGLPWRFKPLEAKIEVHPGEIRVVKFLVTNESSEAITGQAVPSLAPARAAMHFRKIECFCFTQQTLAAGETREMPVRFTVSTQLPKDVHDLTLGYAFFNTDKAQSTRLKVSS